MKKIDLIIHLPVIHKGYLDFFDRKRREINDIYILDEGFIKILLDVKPDIASIDSHIVRQLLKKMGFESVYILKKQDIKKLKGSIMLVDEEVSRVLNERFLIKKNVRWEKVFLRWDKFSVISSLPADSKISKNSFDEKMMKEAYTEAKKSSDWWRQVGAVLVKDGRIVLHAYNKGVPSDHTPYRIGAVRDFLQVGQNPELSSTIHAEQVIITTAAKEGIPLEGLSLYVTHFPCAVCAKLIAYSGIERIYFSEGSSNIDGKMTMESKGMQILAVRNSHAKT